MGKTKFFLLSSRLKRFPRKLAFKLLWLSLFKKLAMVVYYLNSNQKKVFTLIDNIKDEVDFTLNPTEAYQLFQAVKATRNINGDIAEVGVYQGGSAKLICEARNENKILYLFDTFEGLPTPGKFDGSLKKGEYNASLKYVQNCLRSYKNVYFYQGIFPETANSIENKNFSFVHLDVDLYKSTLDALEFFYSRVNRGGVILSHDYGSGGEGETAVKKAFDEFFKDKPEIIIELPSSQCLIVKL